MTAPAAEIALLVLAVFFACGVIAYVGYRQVGNFTEALAAYRQYHSDRKSRRSRATDVEVAA